MKPPINLVHAALFERDPTILTSPDGKRVEVSLEAIRSLLANPHPMLLANGQFSRDATE